MKKTKLLVLLPLLALGGLSACSGNDGIIEYGCDKTYHWIIGDEAAKAKHTFEDEPNKKIESTCKENGKTYKICTECGFEKVDDLKLVDHVLSIDESLTVPATCSAEGTKIEKCANCDFTHTIPIAKTAHTFGAGVEKTEGGKTFLEFECSSCHAKGNNLVSFASVESSGDTATSGKMPDTNGEFVSWKVSLPAGQYDVYFSAKFSPSGANYAFSGSNSRGIEVKYNDELVDFDGTKTAENYGLTTTGYKEFTFFKITATGGIDTLAIQNPFYRLVFDVASDIVFRPVAQ